jgi:HK97 family phage prohead protease
MSNDLFRDLTFKVYSSTFEKSEKDGRRLIRGYASTSTMDLEREIISRKALEKARNDLLKNHTVFIEHNHSALMACGKVVDCILDDKGLLITVELSRAKFVDDIFVLCQENILNSFSIGGIVVDGHDERGEDGKSYYVIDEILILEVSIVGIPCNQEAKFSVLKSFNSAIAEQIKQKEESQKMAKQDKQEVVKTEAPQEPIVEQPKEVAVKDVALEEKQEVVEAPKAPEVALEVAAEVKKEETVEVAKEVIEEPKQEEPALVAKEVEKPIEEKKEEIVEKQEEVKSEPVAEVVKEVVEKATEVIEQAKVDETPSEKAEENPKPEEKAEWTTEYINTLPNSSFAVIEPAYLEGKTEDKNARHLPFKDDNGDVDLPHYRNALARVNQIKPITDSISEADLRSQAAAELEKYRDLLEENKSEKSTEEKILEALALIIEKLSALDKKEVTEKKEEKPEEKQEEYECECLACGEVVKTTEHCGDIKCPKCGGEMRRKERPGVGKEAETIVEKKVEEKVIEKKEETPTRKSLAIVVPSPYDEEAKEVNPKEEERTKNVGWSKLIFGK